MSWPWSNNPPTSTRSGNPQFTSEAREERRKKLEEDRLKKAKAKQDRQNLHRLGVSAPPTPATSRESSPVRFQLDLHSPILESSELNNRNVYS